jgi:hypothetical protein
MPAHAPDPETDLFRPYAEVLLRFAQAAAERTGRPLSDAALEVTNLHRRLGFGRIENGVPAPRWRAFAEGLDAGPTPAARLDWTVAAFAASISGAAPPAPGGQAEFGCFSYELLEDDEVVRIHFTNREDDPDQSPLVQAKVARRRAELEALFADVRARAPAARRVRGGSWLYNLEAYRRLFPAAYVASIRTPPSVRLTGTSTWGQLLDFRGRVKPAARAALLANLPRLDPAAPWTAFPLRALDAECEVEAFYAAYGV